MARRDGIEAFGAKLKLALGRANLSRTALAQQVGVDKSVVARWASGALHPADHSLATLSSALARAIAGFDRTAWDLPLADFGERLGIPGPTRTATGAAPCSPIAALAAAMATEGLVEADAAHSGIWLMLYPSISRPGQLQGYAARLRAGVQAEGALSAEFSSGGTVHAHGYAFPFYFQLHMLFRGRLQDATLGYQILNRPHEDHAEILDGLMSVLGAGVERALGAGRCIWLRLSDATDDASFAAAMGRAHSLAGEWDTALTPDLRAAFVQRDALGQPVMRQARVAPGESWAIGRRSLRLPQAKHHREALSAARAAFQGVVAEPRG